MTAGENSSHAHATQTCTCKIARMLQDFGLTLLQGIFGSSEEDIFGVDIHFRPFIPAPKLSKEWALVLHGFAANKIFSEKHGKNKI